MFTHLTHKVNIFTRRSCKTVIKKSKPYIDIQLIIFFSFLCLRLFSYLPFFILYVRIKRFSATHLIGINLSKNK